jgi:hypothetical protein
MRMPYHHMRAIVIGVAVTAGILFIYHVPIEKTLFSLRPVLAPTATPDRTGWRSYVNQKFGISLKYPPTFQLTPGRSGPLAEWQQYGLTNGIEVASIGIPRSSQIRTNFLGASLRIGVSTEPTAVKECLSPPASFGYHDAYAERTIGGKTFREFTRSDAGAGNFYEYISYRSIRDTGCEVFEYSIHKTNIQNYPAEAGRKEFDRTAVLKSLDSILDTVHFTQ